MAAPKVLSIVLAGGEGKRLMPLTRDRAKPAVPFGGIYRLIDFPLSNLVNSGYRQIVVLTQYKSHSLDRHIAATWRLSPMLHHYVAPVPAQQRKGKNWFLGSADAIYQSLNLLDDDRPDIVVVVGADHVYRMDFSQMVNQHLKTGAAITVAGIRQPLALADQFGIIEADPDKPGLIKAFREKPKDATGLADDPSAVLASMGNYVFTASALIDAVQKDAERVTSRHDMGGDIVPYFVGRGEAGFYDFRDNEVPGATDRDRAYWRDVGTLDVYFDAHMDLISTVPVFNLYNRAWQLYGGPSGLPPAKFTHAEPGRLGHASRSLVSPGVICSGATIYSSIISPDVHLHSWAQVSESVVLDSCDIGRHTEIHKAILDKNVVVKEHATVGVNHDLDRQRGFEVTAGGVTVVPKGSVVEA
ncbi:MAG: glucose-1-phosphate adenylyltransferase [Bifidobacteriaceae bacterium]|jgi:glucose-1-phosphate adenylyltransferase|nr:glucose-1-phosphate adenylyltransferase [Bifidobacteriaceae bacterium]